MPRGYGFIPIVLSFFAAVEQRDFPKYRHKPIAIGYNMKRSVVSTASYEAYPDVTHPKKGKTLFLYLLWK